MAAGRADGGGLGLVVLLREGMAAWMEAWERIPGSPPAHGHPPLPAEGAGAELVRVLASMALGALEGVR